MKVNGAAKFLPHLLHRPAGLPFLSNLRPKFLHLFPVVPGYTGGTHRVLKRLLLLKGDGIRRAGCQRLFSSAG